MDASRYPRLALFVLVVFARKRLAALNSRITSARFAGKFLTRANLGMVATRPLRVANVSREAFSAPINFSNYPTLTVVCAIACISATAGVVEEAGFRGFMLTPIQRRHGWTVAILITGFMFFLDHHFSHSYATFTFLPFFLTISAVHGFLVKYSGSIRPSAVLHAVADFLVIPILYGLVGSLSVAPLSQTGIDKQFLICIVLMVIFGAAAIPAYKHLAAASAATRLGN